MPSKRVEAFYFYVYLGCVLCSVVGCVGAALRNAPGWFLFNSLNALIASRWALEAYDRAGFGRREDNE